jgi:hypothetical protein
MPTLNLDGMNIFYNEYGKELNEYQNNAYYLYMALAHHPLLGEIFQTHCQEVFIQ